MKKYEKEVQQAFLNNEEAVIKRLKQVYNQSLKDINSKAQDLQNQINALQVSLDTVEDATEKERLKSMIQSKVYQRDYQKALKKQVSTILDEMHISEFKTVSDYLTKCYDEGFMGAMYSLQQQGIPLCFPIDQTALVRAVQLDSKISQGLYTRLGEDVALLKKKITATVSRGISTGISWQQMAQQLAGYTNIGYNNAVRICRTEGHRIQVQSAENACHEAKAKGADIVRQWDSTLDGATRPSHQKVDGEIRELDEKFSNGLMFPGDPAGGAAEVVNCRCALLQRARWALDEDELEELKKRAEFFGLDKTENFEDFKKKYLKAADGKVVDPDVQEYLNARDELSKSKKKLAELEEKADRLLGQSMDAMGTDREDALNALFEQAYDEVEAYKERIESLEKSMANKAKKAVKGFERQINANYEFTQPANLDGMTFEAAEKVAGTYQKIFDKYPNLKGKLNGFELKTISDMEDYAQTSFATGASNGRIYLNRMYFKSEEGLEALSQKMKRDVMANHHPKGTASFESVIVHEIGHSIDSNLSGIGLGNKIQQNRILKSLGIDTSDSSAITKGLSAYAKTKPKEFMAEGFAEYILSDNPRDIAKAVGKLYSDKISGTVPNVVEKALEKSVKTIDQLNTNSSKMLADVYERHRIKNGLSSVPYDDMGDMASNVVQANYGKMSVESATAFNDTLSTLANEYDTPLQKIRMMTKDEALGNPSFAFVSHNYTVDAAELVINPLKCKDISGLTDRIKELSKNGYCARIPDEVAEKYIATHEFAHTLLNIDQPLKNSTNWVGADYGMLKKARKEVETVYEKYLKEVKEITEKQKKYELDALMSMDETAWKKAAEAAEELRSVKISNYSLESVDEFMAESFANEKIGTSSNKYGKEVVEILDKYFKR